VTSLSDLSQQLVHVIAQLSVRGLQRLEKTGRKIAVPADLAFERSHHQLVAADVERSRPAIDGCQQILR
jgi:hypothetical protein